MVARDDELGGLRRFDEVFDGRLWAVEDHHRASLELCRAVDSRSTSADAFKAVSTLQAYIEEVRRREGAAGWGAHG